MNKLLIKAVVGGRCHFKLCIQTLGKFDSMDHQQFNTVWKKQFLKFEIFSKN